MIIFTVHISFHLYSACGSVLLGLVRCMVVGPYRDSR